MRARELSQGCSTGTGTLELARDFQVLEAHACDNCQLLKKVDLSNTKIEEIQEFTFVHPCTPYHKSKSLHELCCTARTLTALHCQPSLSGLHSVGLSGSQASINGGE